MQAHVLRDVGGGGGNEVYIRADEMMCGRAAMCRLGLRKTHRDEESNLNIIRGG